MRPSRNKSASLFVGLLSVIVAGCGEPPPLTPGDWNPDEGIAQLRWPLDEMHEERTSFGTFQPQSLRRWLEASPEELPEMLAAELDHPPTADGYRARENFNRTLVMMILESSEHSGNRAKEILEQLVARDFDMDAVITKQGVLPESPGMTRAETIQSVRDVRDRAWEHAMLYLLTGDPAQAEQVKIILLRLAEVVPHWPLYAFADTLWAKAGTAYAQDADAPEFFRITLGSGLWGGWHPMDLAMSLPLLRAYDIVRPTLTVNDREKIEGDLFLHQKRLMERFCGNLPHPPRPNYHNMVGNHLTPLIRFGWVLERPDFIHESVGHWRDMLNHAFSPDGFFKEVSPAYHRQISMRLTQTIPDMLEGYSDPAGYVYPESGDRFDNLDLRRERALAIGRMKSALNVLAMPDGSYASLNDDWPKQARVPDGVALDAPGLLGASGVAKLGTPGMVAFLQFGGMRGHDHHDALNLVWFAGGREVFSDTAYQPLPGSDSTREWHTSTASHNTVAVDEGQHFAVRDKIPESYGYVSYSSYPPQPTGRYRGTHGAEAALPGAAEFANHGRLLLWDASRPQVQAMEAEQENAYPGLTGLFRRTVVMVPLADGEGYLVDIFRIRGGTTHDFFLRGGLDAPYTLDFNVPLQADHRTVYGYIQVKQSGVPGPELKAVATYEGGLRTISHLGGVSGSRPAALELMLGEAPAIRRLGAAPFSVLRRTADNGDGTFESCFVWVHETTTGAERVRKVEVNFDGLDVAVKIERQQGTDRVFSGVSDQSRFDVAGLAFQGRLAYFSDAHPVVFSGSDLTRGPEQVAPGAPFLEGKVLSTTRRDAGFERDSLLVEPSGELPAGAEFRLAHIDMGGFIRFSIPVEKIEPENGFLRVTLAHTPGFVMEDGEVVMTDYPGWRIFDGASVRLNAAINQPTSNP